jgi:hypothetical protein
MKSTKVVLVILFAILLMQCTKEKAGIPFISDANIFQLTTQNDQHNYFKNGLVLAPLGNSPHGNFSLWVNDKAATVLDGDDELPEGGIFPDSSLIVKQIGTPSISLIAVMYKFKSTWYWGEYKPDGEVVISIGQGGGSCVGCHSQSGNRDLTRTYGLH